MAIYGKRDPAGSTPRLEGIGLMLLAMLCLVAVDGSAKWLSAGFGLSQIVFLRSLLAAGALLFVGLTHGRLAALKTHRPGLHLLRSALATGSIYGFFFALGRMPLAEVVTIAFAAPIVITALSVPVLNERVGAARWFAVIAGFSGVLLVLRPGRDIIDIAAFAVLAGTLCYAFLVLTARRMALTESPISLAFYPFLLPILVSGLFTMHAWVAPTWSDWPLFFICGSAGAAAYVFMNKALRLAPPALLAPFEYSAILGAIALGYAVWGEIPTLRTLLGAVTIVAAGLFIVVRETRRGATTSSVEAPPG